MQLTANFHADDQKEHRHQHVVDDEMHIGAPAPWAQRHSQRCMPGGEIAGSPGGVGPDQCGRSREHQHHATEGFDVQQMRDSALQRLGGGLKARNGGRGGWAV